MKMAFLVMPLPLMLIRHSRRNNTSKRKTYRIYCPGNARADLLDQKLNGYYVTPVMREIAKSGISIKYAL